MCLFEHIDQSLVRFFFYLPVTVCKKAIFVCVQSAGAAEASVPSTEGTRIWSQTRDHLTHIPAIISIKSHAALSR